jgi:hypothetical protein
MHGESQGVRCCNRVSAEDSSPVIAKKTEA